VLLNNFMNKSELSSKRLQMNNNNSSSKISRIEYLVLVYKHLPPNLVCFSSPTIIRPECPAYIKYRWCNRSQLHQKWGNIMICLRWLKAESILIQASFRRWVCHAVSKHHRGKRSRSLLLLLTSCKVLYKEYSLTKIRWKDSKCKMSHCQDEFNSM